MSSISGLDTWSIISGAIGVLTALPFIWAFARSQHPETRLAQLESTLKDTEVLFQSAIEEGLLHPERHVPHFELSLRALRTKTEKIREETFIATIEWRKLLKAWLHGLSRRIANLCVQVKDVRVDICETSAGARMQLMQQLPGDASRPNPDSRGGVARLWRYIVSLVCRRPDTGAITSESTTSASSVVDSIGASTDNGTTSSVMDHIPSTSAPHHSHTPPPKAPAHRPRLSSRVLGTAPHVHEFHMLVRTIRRVDRELTAQGVTNALLTHLVQSTHKKWSPASNKAYRPRHSRRHRNSVFGTVQVATTPQPDVDSDESDSSGEDTMCEV